jgi:N-acetylglutamate synthase-like GNAT family acetyltransferase
MINDIFQDSWSFVNITEEEYLYIYKDYEQNINNLSIQIISDKDGKDVGFCSSIIDPINNIIILKTIGVLSEYQNKRVGAALLHYQHKIAQEKEFTKEIYALIKLGNIVTKLPYPGIKVIRKYVALEKEITQ